MKEQPHGNAHPPPSDSEPDLPLRKARQGEAARGIHDLRGLADGELTYRVSPEAGPRPPLAGPPAPEDTTSAEGLSTPVAHQEGYLRYSASFSRCRRVVRCAYIVVVVMTACPSAS